MMTNQKYSSAVYVNDESIKERQNVKTHCLSWRNLILIKIVNLA